jgi:hypothetical protein
VSLFRNQIAASDQIQWDEELVVSVLMCSADLKWFELAFLVSELSNG